MNNSMIDNSQRNVTSARSEQHADDASINLRSYAYTLVSSSCPKRYVIALLLCILLLIQVARQLNANFIFVEHLVSSEVASPSAENWSIENLGNIFYIIKIGNIFAALVGGFVIYKNSSHKFILASVTISSILHMLKPTALQNSLTLFWIVRILHDVVSVPVFIAALTIWKYWAPPEERMRLVTISLCALILQGTGPTLNLLLFSNLLKYLNYYIGAAGLIGVFIWFVIAADSPQNVSLISEKEYLYLESKIPSNIHEKIKLKDVPWMSILKCKQIFILSAIFFKLACSVATIEAVGPIIFMQQYLNDMYSRVYRQISTEPKVSLPTFICALAIILIGVSVTMDFYMNHYNCKSYNLKIRKLFICGGFVLQCCFMVLASISTSEYSKHIHFILAYTAFGFSVPGCLTYPLDISPRYVPLTSGIALAFFYFGTFSFYFIQQNFLSWITFQSPLSWLYLIDGSITLFTAIVFGIWGDVEEQQWSLVLSSRHRSQDNASYTKSDDNKDLRLVEVQA